MRQLTTVLTIAGSDCSGGAGLQADIRTIGQLGGHAASVVTALTVQNSMGVLHSESVSATLVRQQLRAVLNDLQPLAIKTGMLPTREVVEVVAQELTAYRQSHPDVCIVLDPVMVSTSGMPLMDASAIGTFVAQLYPLCTLITPNIPEAKVLSGHGIAPGKDAHAWLVKGGHAEGEEKCDRLYAGGKVAWFHHSAVYTQGMHGTGCRLSSAIATLLAMGQPLAEAVRGGIDCLQADLQASVGVSYGLGPMRVQFISHETERFTQLLGVEQALMGGCRWIQLRMKQASAERIVDTGRRMAELCHHYGAVLIVDDHVDLVSAIGADGVHLGRHDMSPVMARRLLGNQYIIGGTANTIDDVRQLAAAGVDYIGCGPYRYTTTKSNLAPILGLEGYQAITRQMRQEGIRIPMVAIGGIEPADVAPLLDSGVQGVAVSGTVLRANRPKEQMKLIINQIKEHNEYHTY